MVSAGPLVAGRGPRLHLTASRGVMLPNDVRRSGSGETLGVPHRILVSLLVAVAAQVVL